jgi:hypothetical protein
VPLAAITHNDYNVLSFMITTFNGLREVFGNFYLMLTTPSHSWCF